jgi:molybdopterin/thiamine biosynthesis adenylyltransferase
MSELGTYDHLTRQMDLIPVDTLGMPINIIGCGAIGSFACLALVKMGLNNINVWDMDDVSVENMSNQFFRFSDIGKNKAVALHSLVKDFTGVDITAHPAAFLSNHVLQGIVISAVDDMDVRRAIFEHIKDSSFRVKNIIDPRMAAEFYTQYTVNPFDEKDDSMYNKVLHSNEDSVQQACTSKSTIYTAQLASGLIAKTVKNIITKQDYIRILDWDLKGNEDGCMSMTGS